MSYVLLVLLVTDTPRPATWTAEFTSQERCEAAGKAAAQTFKPASGYRGVSYVCTPK